MARQLPFTNRAATNDPGRPAEVRRLSDSRYLWRTIGTVGVTSLLCVTILLLFSSDSWGRGFGGGGRGGGRGGGGFGGGFSGRGGWRKLWWWGRSELRQLGRWPRRVRSEWTKRGRWFRRRRRSETKLHGPWTRWQRGKCSGSKPGWFRSRYRGPRRRREERSRLSRRRPKW